MTDATTRPASATPPVQHPESSGMVDWDLAVATGVRLVRPGPEVSADEAREVVADLRRHARAAQEHVREVTGLVAPGGESGGVAVIDRPGWIRANADGFRTIVEPVANKLKEKRRPSALSTAVGSRLTAVETGSLLAFLSSKVLGQYELFPPYGSGVEVPQGRLLLVAPNIVSAEREMHVDPRDFRLWVCMHEETHRVQFGAVPWLRGYVIAEVERLLEATDVDPSVLLRRLGSVAGAVGDALRGDDGLSLVEAMQGPEQRVILDRLTAVMSLLEGHADHVMDAVGPDVIPSVVAIRERFQRRREGASRLDQVVRRLLGIEAKMRQYRDGAQFVRAVEARVGRDGFNVVWTAPETLPTQAEILDPELWVRRLHPDAGTVLV